MVDTSRALPEQADGPLTSRGEQHDLDHNAGKATPAASVNAGVTASEGLALHVEIPEPDVRVVRVAGELDLLTAPQLADRLHSELTPPPAHLIIDLADVSYLGSTGLQVLVEIHTAADVSHSQLWLTGATAPAVRQPLQWTGLLSLFTCFDTVDQALSELR